VAHELLQVIDADNLPEEYGGRCRCPGVGGCIRNAPEERKVWAHVSHQIYWAPPPLGTH
jgi:hypothetical protein